MQHGSVKQITMMKANYITNSEGTSLENNLRVNQTRKILLIIAGVCFGICVVYAIAAISGCACSCRAADHTAAEPIAVAFIWILFYGFGIIVAYRYYQIGIRVFAWLGVIMVVGTVLTLTPIEVDFVPYSCVKNGVGEHEASWVATIIYFILCILVLVLTIIIVVLTFKLAKLLNGNQQSAAQQV